MAEKEAAVCVLLALVDEEGEITSGPTQSASFNLFLVSSSVGRHLLAAMLANMLARFVRLCPALLHLLKSIPEVDLLHSS